MATFLSTNLVLSGAFCPSFRPKRTIAVLQASSLEVDINNVDDGDEDVTIPGSSNATIPATTTATLERPDDDSLPENMLTLPRHSSPDANEVLIETEHLIRNMHRHSKRIDPKQRIRERRKQQSPRDGSSYDAIFANTYVDLGKVDTVGFDYDYTLVTYTEELLELIYDKALKRLVHDRQYPLEMLDAGLAFDPFFSIRGR